MRKLSLIAVLASLLIAGLYAYVVGAGTMDSSAKSAEKSACCAGH